MELSLNLIPNVLQPGNMAFTISSLNVKVLNRPYKRQMTWKEACQLQSDVICFQETHFSSHHAPTFQHDRTETDSSTI